MTTRPDAFRDFYNRALPRVYSYFHQRLSANLGLAADLTERTLVALVDDWPLDPLEDGVVHAESIARSHLVQHLTAEAQISRRLVKAVGRDTGSQRGEAPQPEVTLHAALDRLAPLERAAMVLRFIDDLGIDEVAAALGKSLRATEALLMRAERGLKAAPQDPTGSEELRRGLRRLDRPILVPQDLSRSLFTRVSDTAATKEGRVRDDLAPGVLEMLELPERSRLRTMLIALAALVGSAAIVGGVLVFVNRDEATQEPVATTLAASPAPTSTVATTTTSPPPPRRTQQAGLPVGPPGWTALDPGPLQGTGSTSTWAASQLFVWTNTGFASYNSRLDTWTDHVAPPVQFGEDSLLVSTGAGVAALSRLGSGAVFNTVRGTWRAMAQGPSDHRRLVDAVWMDTELLVVAHVSEDARGPGDLVAATYDPATDEWSPVAAPPVKLSYADASWTGTTAVMYGGWLGPNNEPRSADGNAGGARFDPVDDSWSLLPAHSLSPNAVSSTWIEDRLIAWDYLLVAASYDLVEGWSSLDPVPLPAQECVNHSVAVRTSSGPALVGWYCDSAAILRVTDGAWQRVAVPLDEDFTAVPLGAPVSGDEEVYFWTAGSFWVFTPDNAVPGGAVDAGGGWSVLATGPADRRIEATVTWAEDASEIIVWGGRDGPDAPARNDGAVYDIGRDDWYLLPPAPIEPRTQHAAIWTGSDLIVWGGGVDAQGAAYSPVAGRWRVIAESPIRGPELPSAVWTGTEMVVWGGRISNTGGSSPSWEGAAYDPAADAWRQIPQAPIPEREEHTAVWTGSEMIVFGGRSDERGLVTGAAFDPATDTWRQIADLPDLELTAHNAVWTGREMVVTGPNFDRLDRDDSFDEPEFAAAAYDPVSDSWRPLVLPASLSVSDLAPVHSTAWTGSRVALWVGSALSPEGPQVWLYDPVADAWQKGAVAPSEPFGAAVWAGDRLFVPGRAFPVAESRALTYALGANGSTIPPIPGTEVAFDIGEAIDLRLYAFRRNAASGDGGGPEASVIDLAGRSRIDYAAGEHTLGFAAGPDRATAVGDRSVAVTLDGAVYLHDRSLYREPSVVREITPGRRPGVAPAVYVDSAESLLWVFDYGTDCCAESLSADPGLVRLIDATSGDVVLNTELPTNATPVQATQQGLLVNFEEFVPTADGFVSDPESHTYAILQPGGGFVLAGDGHATAMAGDAIVRVRCTGLVDQDCTLRITDEVTGNRPVDPPGASVWVQYSQPGTSLASPDGRWVVAAAKRVNDINGNPIPVLVDVRLGTAEALSFGRFDRPGAVVAWDRSGRWLVILGEEPVAFNVESKRFIQLGDLVPDGLVVYAAG